MNLVGTAQARAIEPPDDHHIAIVDAFGIARVIDPYGLAVAIGQRSTIDLRQVAASERTDTPPGFASLAPFEQLGQRLFTPGHFDRLFGGLFRLGGCGQQGREFLP